MATIINAPVKAAGTVSYPKLRVILDSLQFTLDSIVGTNLTANRIVITDSSANLTTSSDIVVSSGKIQLGLQLQADPGSLSTPGLSFRLGTQEGFYRYSSGGHGYVGVAIESKQITEFAYTGGTFFGTWSCRPETSNPTVARLNLFSPTASFGQISFVPADNAGNFTLSLVNASLAADRTYTFPDVGASASFVMTQGAQTLTGLKTFMSGIDISYSAVAGLTIGADNGATTRTSSTQKRFRIASYPYDNGTPISLLYGVNDTSASDIYMGGGSLGMNAATGLHFYTAANNSTASGTERLAIDSTGLATFTGGVTTTMASSGAFLAQASRSGDVVGLLVDNTSNTASSDAKLRARVAGTSAGDALSVFDISGSTAWAIGLDNSDSDSFKISQNSGLGTNDYLTVTTGGDVYTVAYQDYSGTSTIVGWTTFSTKKLFYKKVGKTVYIWVDLLGTSNATTTSFTLPYTCSNDINHRIPAYITDNGTAAVGRMNLSANSSSCTVDATIGGAGWTSSGTKQVRIQFNYQTT